MSKYRRNADKEAFRMKRETCPEVDSALDDIKDADPSDFWPAVEEARRRIKAETAALREALIEAIEASMEIEESLEDVTRERDDLQREVEGLRREVRDLEAAQ